MFIRREDISLHYYFDTELKSVQFADHKLKNLEKLAHRSFDNAIKHYLKNGSIYHENCFSDIFDGVKKALQVIGYEIHYREKVAIPFYVAKEIFAELGEKPVESLKDREASI
ncbi:hypothetical protein ACERII_02075 [Evansella sp. AB-rgal1]|uniref:hypothetical protein n=1 Tax=Evansella sp. AB-rgal1 TaxID=3242696 RepID=UPI00359D0D4D